ncbi:xylose isomerase-like protein [Pyronema omphalodes]|nr:xylose isomerase-like protein [Pyronema omphalodes]
MTSVISALTAAKHFPQSPVFTRRKVDPIPTNINTINNNTKTYTMKNANNNTTSKKMPTEVDHIPLSYATPSLGMHPSHTLEHKLSAISAAGFMGIELGFDDLLSFAQRYLHNPTISATSYDQLCIAAQKVRLLCAPNNNNLTILVLQPFNNFEGYTGEKRKAAFEKAAGWKRILEALGCDMLQVGSNDDPESSGDYDTIARDLKELADLMAPKKIAYENWCWGAHVNTWAHVNDICKRVSRENFGLCLDTFQTAGKEWADPTTVSGLVEGVRDREDNWFESMRQLAITIPGEKIFFFQISDALKMEKPLKDRREWSHGYRVNPYCGGYLPVEDMVRAVLKTGFRGWVSVEVFNEEEHGKEWREGLEEGWAKEGMESVRKLLKECSGVV